MAVFNLWRLCHEALAKWRAQQDSLDTVGICGETVIKNRHFMPVFNSWRAQQDSNLQPTD